MKKYLDAVQYVNLQFNDKILKYCTPFFSCLNVNNFWYSKLTSDGILTFIQSNADWAECFAGHDFHLIYYPLVLPKVPRKAISIHKGGSDGPFQKIYTQASKFGMQQSLVFSKQDAGGVEEFGFSSASLGDEQTECFLNELQLFRLFAQKFKEDNSRWLSKLADVEINIAEMIGSHFFKNSEDAAPPSERAVVLKKLGVDLPSTLTVRETEVVHWLLEGYSAADIALKLFLSKRTVEHHLERIKDKLNCESKAELISKVRKFERFGLQSSLSGSFL